MKTDRYTDTLNTIYDSASIQVCLSARWMATEALVRLAFPRDLHEDGYFLAHEALAQRSRAVLRQRSVGKPASSQYDMWPDLQDRYPIPEKDEDGDHVYKLREHLTDSEIDFNINRLRSEAEAKLKHADALEAYRASRIKRAAE